MSRQPRQPGLIQRVVAAIRNRPAGPSGPRTIKVIRQPGQERTFFDGADSNKYTQNHFAHATTADINTVVRADLPRLRQWCRYEGHNNGYARGIIETLANDIVGRGPRAQVTIDGEGPDETIAQRIEDDWARWCEHCDADGRQSFGEMLALAVKQCPAAGEAFIVMTSDPAARPNEVALRLRLIEGDRVSTPYGLFVDKTVADGIRFDAERRPTHYLVLKKHPGDTGSLTIVNPADYDEVPAGQIVHVYRPERPSQHRGIPWFASALIPLAHLRRYTLATVNAAENAASISAVTYTTLPGVDVKADEEFDEVEIPRGSLLTLPAGYDMKPFTPSQPTATYATFKGEILDEIGRGLSMPHNVVAGNSSGYNYASGRLDWQTYFRMIRTDQAWIGRLCTRIFRAWYAEYYMTRRTLSTLAGAARPEVQWFWPGHQHVDPAKEANAQRIRLNSLTTTLEDEWAALGFDWRRKVKQIAVERDFVADLGLRIEDAAPAVAAIEDAQAAEAAAETAAQDTTDDEATSQTAAA